MEVNAWWNTETVEIVISDDGPGIAPDILKRIGEPYLSRRRSADEAQSERSGLGLGVFIARTLLERTGAKVSFSNRIFPDHGAVVQIAWPREPLRGRTKSLPDQRIRASSRPGEAGQSTLGGLGSAIAAPYASRHPQRGCT